ncbi:MAG: sugar nucleotide-binding protein [Pirellula sp.]
MYLLIGSSGYVGSHFQHWLRLRKIPFAMLSRKNCNLFDVASLVNALRMSNAHFVINCAGYTGKPNVDACELHKSECLMGNAVLPGVLDQACKQAEVCWGHVSSGCIYTGTDSSGRGFTEESPPNFSFRTNNCSFYSGTKALGEEVLADSDRVYIWRLRIPFNHVDNPRNYLSKLIRYPKLLDVMNSLCNIDDFVNACIDCVEKKLPLGTYNLTNTGCISTREITQLLRPIVEEKKIFRFFDSEQDFMNQVAKSPRSSCVLDNTKALSHGLKLTDVTPAIRQCVENWTTDTHREEQTV